MKKINRRMIRRLILQEMARAYDYRRDPSFRGAGRLSDMPSEIDLSTGEETYDLDLSDPAVVGIGDLSTDEEKRRAELAYAQATMHDAPGSSSVDREQFMADFEDEMVLDRLHPSERDAYLAKRANKITEGNINRAMIRRMIFDALK